jgi:hypothetical protein
MSVKYKRVQSIEADCIRILYRPAEVDADGLENEGNSLSSEERVSLGTPTKLLADRIYPAYAARLDEAN